MNTFFVGIVVGFVLFGIMACVIIFNRMQVEMTRLAKEADNMNKALQMMFLKINKIEKITENTMSAAENFVDALRASAEQMSNHMRPPNMGRLHPDTFDDLRKSFEEGIKDIEQGMEDTSVEDDEDSEEPDEPWK